MIENEWFEVMVGSLRGGQLLGLDPPSCQNLEKKVCVQNVSWVKTVVGQVSSAGTP